MWNGNLFRAKIKFISDFGCSMLINMNPNHKLPPSIDLVLANSAMKWKPINWFWIEFEAHTYIKPN